MRAITHSVCIATMAAASWLFISCGGAEEIGPGAYGPAGKGECLEGCNAAQVVPAEESDLPPIRGGRDTGYLSTLAAEIEGVFHGTLSLTYATEEEAAEAAREYENPNSYKLTRLTTDQLKLAKNKLNTELLHINLSASSPKQRTVQVADATVTIDYVLSAESVVSHEELDEAGVSINDLINKVNEARVLGDPRTPVTRLAQIAAAENAAECANAPSDMSNHDLFEKCVEPLVKKCAKGYDEQLRDYNFFYYFDAEATDCPLQPQVTVQFIVQDAIKGKQVFPEFDELSRPWRSTYTVVDQAGEKSTQTYDEPANLVSAVIFFGAADHDYKPGDWDWGAYQWRLFNDTLFDRGFVDTEDYSHEWVTEGEGENATLVQRPVGRRWIRDRNASQQLCTFGVDADCTRVVVDVISPADLHNLKDYSQHNSTVGLFHQALRTHEIMMYAGHSFYGSLDVLDYPENYARNYLVDEVEGEAVYQVLFMASCWSYEYYTKQVFDNKLSARDSLGCVDSQGLPLDHGCKGWAKVDVVNDTESGWFHNNTAMARILFTNLFRGVQSGGYEQHPDGARAFTWNEIIAQMNTHAIEDQKNRGSETHEIFGVSGVRTNQYCPAGAPSEVCE